MEKPSFNPEQNAGIAEVYKRIRTTVFNNNAFDKKQPLVIYYLELLDELIEILETKSHLGFSANYITKLTDSIKKVADAVYLQGRLEITHNQIVEGKNLEYHRKQVEGALKEIDEKIKIQKSEGKEIKHFETIRNTLILLQQKIVEKN